MLLVPNLNGHTFPNPTLRLVLICIIFWRCNTFSPRNLASCSRRFTINSQYFVFFLPDVQVIWLFKRSIKTSPCAECFACARTMPGTAVVCRELGYCWRWDVLYLRRDATAILISLTHSRRRHCAGLGRTTETYDETQCSMH
ncbi:hypothetical protein C8R45DRAFT_1036131 [Mycena sanguinolenta]|nr:hypothetical protein C8R45DRAFT_1036131 [Mycena sanguinolenta]